jgi:hypothetical protein
MCLVIKERDRENESTHERDQVVKGLMFATFISVLSVYIK